MHSPFVCVVHLVCFASELLLTCANLTQASFHLPLCAPSTAGRKFPLPNLDWFPRHKKPEHNQEGVTFASHSSGSEKCPWKAQHEQQVSIVHWELGAIGTTTHLSVGSSLTASWPFRWQKIFPEDFHTVEPQVCYSLLNEMCHA